MFWGLQREMWGFKLKSVCMNWYVHENWQKPFFFTTRMKNLKSAYKIFGCKGVLWASGKGNVVISNLKCYFGKIQASEACFFIFLRIIKLK